MTKEIIIVVLVIVLIYLLYFWSQKKPVSESWEKTPPPLQILKISKPDYRLGLIYLTDKPVYFQGHSITEIVFGFSALYFEFRKLFPEAGECEIFFREYRLERDEFEKGVCLRIRREYDILVDHKKIKRKKSWEIGDSDDSDLGRIKDGSLKMKFGEDHSELTESESDDSS